MLDFFARPALLMLAPVIYWLLRGAFYQQTASRWQAHIEPRLAQRLLTAETTCNFSRLPKWLVLAVLTSMLTLYLAGPGYPVQLDELKRQQQEVVVIQRLAPVQRGDTSGQHLLDASQRLLVPFLNQRVQGQTALVFYAGSAHLASPMTADAATLRQLVSLAHPSVMPLAGDRPEAAFAVAAQTGHLANAGQATEPLYWLWLTDRLPEKETLNRLLDTKPAAAELILLPLEMELNAPLKQELSRLAVTLVMPTEAPAFLASLNQPEGTARLSEAGQLQVFQEFGHWLLLPAVVVLLWQWLGQPRLLPNRLTSLLVVWLLIGQTTDLEAGRLHQDFAAWQAWQQGQPEKVLDQTRRPDLLATAWFELGDYEQAARAFELALQEGSAANQGQQQRLDLLFNTGTAWLFAGDYEQALSYLDKVREEDPEGEHTCINWQLASLLEQQQPLPLNQEDLLQACFGGQAPEQQQTPSKASEAPASSSPWQPSSARSACPDCLPLSPDQEASLDKLQEDPWRLLRNRFRYELREANR